MQAETQHRGDAALAVQAARLPRSAAAEHASGSEAAHAAAAAAAADVELLVAPRMLCSVAAAHGAAVAPLADATNTRQ